MFSVKRLTVGPKFDQEQEGLDDSSCHWWNSDWLPIRFVPVWVCWRGGQSVLDDLDHLYRDEGWWRGWQRVAPRTLARGAAGPDWHWTPNLTNIRPSQQKITLDYPWRKSCMKIFENCSTLWPTVYSIVRNDLPTTTAKNGKHGKNLIFPYFIFSFYLFLLYFYFYQSSFFLPATFGNGRVIPVLSVEIWGDSLLFLILWLDLVREMVYLQIFYFSTFTSLEYLFTRGKGIKFFSVHKFLLEIISFLFSAINSTFQT